VSRRPDANALEVAGDSLASQDLDQSLAFLGIGVELRRIDSLQMLRIGKAEQLDVSRIDLEQSPSGLLRKTPTGTRS